MHLYTPRGLKIRLPIPYAFALIKRLYPERTAHQVLTTAEAVAAIPSLLSNIALLTTLFASNSLWESAIAGAVAVLLGEIIIWNGLFLIPGLPTMALVWSYFPWFLRVPAVAILGCVLRGWKGLATVLLAYSVAALSGLAAELLFTSLRSRPGLTVTVSEACFFDAYNLHASGVGAITRDMGVSDDELEEDNWISLFLEYVGGLSDSVRHMMGM